MTNTKNKTVAVNFLRMCAGGSVRSAYELYTTENFIHHNPYFKGDKAALICAMEESAQQEPNKILDVKKVLEDGMYVAVHSHITLPNNEPGITVVHICRFENEYIAELWDIAMIIPENSPNENGIF